MALTVGLLGYAGYDNYTLRQERDEAYGAAFGILMQLQMCVKELDRNHI